MVNGVAGTVNHHSAGAGEFSVGDLGNFQLALTQVIRARSLELADEAGRPISHWVSTRAKV